MGIVYILRLNENKFYIDYAETQKTFDMQIWLHFSDVNIGWTEKYKPMSIYKIHNNCKKEDSEKYTKIMMSKYGIENVRGGIYKKTELDNIDVEILSKELRIDIQTQDDIDIWHCKNCDREYDDEQEYREHEYNCIRRINICYKCDKRGHFTSDC